MGRHVAYKVMLIHVTYLQAKIVHDTLCDVRFKNVRTNHIFVNDDSWVSLQRHKQLFADNCASFRFRTQSYVGFPFFLLHYKRLGCVFSFFISENLGACGERFDTFAGWAVPLEQPKTNQIKQPKSQ